MVSILFLWTALTLSLSKCVKSRYFFSTIQICDLIMKNIFRGFSLRIPYANGKEFDLYELYEAVVSLGGWQKVTNFDRWGEGFFINYKIKNILKQV
jgi:hypothetical protein